MDKFIASYRQGKTPNPCIDCNRYLKFEKLFHRAEELGCDAIATGHYARITQETAATSSAKRGTSERTRAMSSTP